MTNIIGEHEVYRDGRNVGIVTVTEEGLMTVISCACEILNGGVFRLAAVSGDEFVSLGVTAPDGGRLRLRKSYTKSALGALRLDENTSFYLILSGETLSGLKTEEDVPAVKLTLGARSNPSEPEPEPEPEPEIEPEEVKPAPPENELEPNIPAVPNLQEAAPPPVTPPVIPEDIRETPRKDTTPKDPGPWKPIQDPASLFSDGDIQQACKNARGALTTERGGFTMLAIPAVSDEPFPMMPVFCFGSSEMIGGEEYIVFKTKNGSLAV